MFKLNCHASKLGSLNLMSTLIPVDKGCSQPLSEKPGPTKKGIEERFMAPADAENEQQVWTSPKPNMYAHN